MTVAPFALWRGPVPNRTPAGMSLPSHGLVLHVMESTLDAADSWFHNPAAKVSAHFGVNFDGGIVQWVDWEDKAWAEMAGNPDYHSVETSGYNDVALTEAQVQSVATIYAEGHRRYGWPFQLADAPGEHGLGTHAMGGTAWGGHTACPGPQRTAQRSRILIVAQGGGDDDMTPDEHQRLVNAESDAHTAMVHSANCEAALGRIEQGHEQFVADIAAIKAKVGA